MENITTVKSKIDLIDEEITHKYVDELRAKESRIDFTKDGWVEEMRSIESEYRDKIQPELAYIRTTIGEVLAGNAFKDLQNMATLLEDTQRLKNYITPTFEELDLNVLSGSAEYVTLSLVLFMARNLEPDARDEMVYFGDLIRFCESKRIDVKTILQKLLPYAFDEIKYGTYSVRSLFEDAIKQQSAAAGKPK
jgi:NhaP-type Na+/H+ and K+/H+ antiporter